MSTPTKLLVALALALVVAAPSDTHAQPATVAVMAANAAGSGSGSADTPPAKPDPVVAAQTAVDTAADTGSQLVVDYGPLWAAFLALLASARYLLKRNESEHWLAQGRTLAMLTGGLMILAAIADWKFKGAQFAGVIVTAVMAFKLAFPSSVKSGSVASASQAGFARLPVLLVLALAGMLLASQAACVSSAQVKAAPGAGKDALVACAKEGAPGELALIGQLAASTFAALTDTGSPNWPTLEAMAIAQGKVLGGCAYTKFVAAMQAIPATAARTQGLIAQPDLGADAAASLERVRAAFGGVTWSVAP